MSARTDTEAAATQASTGITPDTLKSKLIEKLEAAHVDIEDLSGMPCCGSNPQDFTVSLDHDRWMWSDV